jgi:Zinc finger, C2H2 type
MDPSLYQCGICEKTLKSKNNLKRHIAKHQPPKKQRCIIGILPPWVPHSTPEDFARAFLLPSTKRSGSDLTKSEYLFMSSLNKTLIDRLDKLRCVTGCQDEPTEIDFIINLIKSTDERLKDLHTYIKEQGYDRYHPANEINLTLD